MSAGKIIGIVLMVAGVLGVIFGIIRVNEASFYMMGMHFKPEMSDYFPIIGGIVGIVVGLFVTIKAK